MLGIAFITLAVLLVLFGVCAFMVYRNANKEDYEEDYEVENNEIAADEEPEDDTSEPDEESAEDDNNAEPKKAYAAAFASAIGARLNSVLSKSKSNDTSLDDNNKADEVIEASPSTEEGGVTRIASKEEMEQIKLAAAASLGETTKEEPAEPVAEPDIEPIAEPEVVKAASHGTDAEELDMTSVRSPIPYDDDEEDEDDEDEKRSSVLIPVVAISAAVLVALGAVAFALVRNDARKHKLEAIAPPETVSVTVGTVHEEEIFSGKVVCDSPELRFFAASGKVTDVKVLEGDKVKKGQELYILDSSALEERISILKERLKNTSVTTEQTVREDISIKAPSAGTISTVYVSEGDKLTEGTAIAQISAVSDYRVTLSFDGSDSGEISTGDSATVHLDNTNVNGTVTAVSKDEAENLDGGTAVTYIATISFRTSLSPTSVSATINDTKSIGSAAVSAGNKNNTVIRASASGTLKELRIKAGASVTEGQLAAVIETSKTVTETKTDELEAKDIQLQIEQLENELQNYTVKADSSGYIKKLYAKKGESVAVNQQAAIIIPDGSLSLSVEMLAETAEKLTLPAHATYKFKRGGNVPSEVWSVVSIEEEHSATMDAAEPDDSDETKVNGHIAIDDQNGLCEGVLATVRVVTYTNFDALLIPEEALNGDKVRIWRDGQVYEIRVETGITTDDKMVEIKSGLTIDDDIIIGEIAAGE